MKAKNISYHFPFQDFITLLERTSPARDYQWNRLVVELTRGGFTTRTLADIAGLTRSVVEHYGIRPPHLHQLIRWASRKGRKQAA